MPKQKNDIDTLVANIGKTAKIRDLKYQVRQAALAEALAAVGEKTGVKDPSHTKPCYCEYRKTGERMGFCLRCVEMCYAAQDKTKNRIRKNITTLMEKG